MIGLVYACVRRLTRPSSISASQYWRCGLAFSDVRASNEGLPRPRVARAQGIVRPSSFSLHQNLPGCPARKSGEEWQPVAKRRHIPSWFTKAPPGRAGFFTLFSPALEGCSLSAFFRHPQGGWPDCPSLRASSDHRFIVGPLRARRIVWLLPCCP